jgi:hypothetical protein
MGDIDGIDQGEADRTNSGPRASRPYMPGYGLLDASSGRGLLPWSWAIDRLSKAKNYYISTTTADALPHCMPVWVMAR